MAVATVNFPEVSIPEGCAAFKTWSENMGLIEVLHFAGIVGDWDHYLTLESNMCIDDRGLRAIEVTYECGEVITTSMASGLTDKQMLNYFKPGKVFNLGQGEHDRLSKVKSRKILK